MKIRYIRDWLNGSSSNGGNHWVKIQAYPVVAAPAHPNPEVWYSGFRTDVASLTIGASVSSSVARAYAGGASDTTLIDSSYPDTSKYISADGGGQYIQIDLGASLDVEEIWVWHYWADGRTYNHQLQIASTVGAAANQWLTVQPWTWGRPESANGRRYILPSVTSGVFAAQIYGSSDVYAETGDLTKDSFIHNFLELVNSARFANNLPIKTDGTDISFDDENNNMTIADINAVITALNQATAANRATIAADSLISALNFPALAQDAWETQQFKKYTACNGSTCAAACVVSCTTYCGSASCGYSCGTGCSGACGTGCYHACGTGCYHACGTGCYHACGGSTCTTTCGGNTCGVNCGTACAGGCIGSCGGGCGYACAQRCEGCSGACDGQWVPGHRVCLKHTCEGACQNSCYYWCGAVCSTNTCSNTCTAYCSGTCSGDGCVATCTGGCAGACKGGCSSSCAGGCSSSCAGGCSSSCAGGCASACTGFCQTTCQTSCTGGCSGSCVSMAT